MPHVTRRLFSLAAITGGAATLSGCMGAGKPVLGSLFGSEGERRDSGTLGKPNYAEIYASNLGEQYPIEPFRYAAVDPAFLRQDVAYAGSEAPGTIVVDPHARHLYLVQRGRKATRYGVGVGRDGFAWNGAAQINMRRAWPDWIPPGEMVQRDPEIRSRLVETRRGRGLPGGPENPLGARAMYLYANGDTGYRIHGTTEPETIGTSVSSGCIRMVNQDVIHLYGRAPDGTKVVVLA